MAEIATFGSDGERVEVDDVNEMEANYVHMNIWYDRYTTNDGS